MRVGSEGGSKEERWQTANGRAELSGALKGAWRGDMKEQSQLGRYRWCEGGDKEPIRKPEERTVRKQSGL